MTDGRLTEEELNVLRVVACNETMAIMDSPMYRRGMALGKLLERCAELEARVAELTNALKPFAVGCLLDDSGVSTGKPNPNCCCHCFARHALREPPKESDDE